MRTAGAPILLLLTLPVLACGRSSTAEPSREPIVVGEMQRGISYAHATGRRRNRGYGSPASTESLQVLKDLGVNWISITPYGFQRTPEDTAIRWSGSRFGETDDRLRAVAAQAHELGIKVMLKPHLWLRPPNWVGMIEHHSEEAWKAWFEAYRELILHYAALAQDVAMDALCIGNEMTETTGREREWRDLIAEIRETFDGTLTYGANFDEVYDVPFWDALDFIGVSAYYPLASGRAPDREALVAAWQPLITSLENLSIKWSKPIVFTELGYRSSDFAPEHPWQVDRAAVNLRVQADAYAAFFEAVWPQPWFGGVYWWKWFSFPDDGGPTDNDFTPRNKPAERVLGRYYTRR